MLSATVGIQPNHVAEASPTAWDEIVALVSRPGVVALGETGLDRHWDYTPFAQQEDYFARHLLGSSADSIDIIELNREREQTGERRPR